MSQESQVRLPQCHASDLRCSDANVATLWCAVIDRAITDLHDKSVGRIQREEALAWIRDDGEGFGEVCDLAGVDDVKLREGILRGLLVTEQSKQAREVERPIAMPDVDPPEIAMPKLTATPEGVPA